MSDSRMRSLERAVSQGDQDAKAALVFELVRAGAEMRAAQRQVYGCAPGDVYTWKHPKTGTVHACRINSTYAYCGRDPVGTYVDCPGRGLRTIYDKRWRRLAEVTCKRCHMNFRWWQHTAAGEKRWGMTMPSWDMFRFR